MSDLYSLFSLGPTVAMSTNTDALRSLGTNESITQQVRIPNNLGELSVLLYEKAVLTAPIGSLRKVAVPNHFSCSRDGNSFIGGQ